MFETMKQSELLQMQRDLEEYANKIKMEIRVRKLLDDVNSNSKWLESQSMRLSNPSEYYTFRLNDKAVTITKNKRKYWLNLGKYDNAKIWTYGIETAGFRPITFKQKDKELKFDVDTNRYGAFKNLEQAIYWYVQAVKELIYTYEITDKAQEELFETTHSFDMKNIYEIKDYENGFMTKTKQ